MSLAIQTSTVAEVLLADGWHKVADQSFDLDAYEFMEEERTVVGGGQVQGVPSTGFYFHEPSGMVCVGPLTSVLALRCTVTD